MHWQDFSENEQLDLLALYVIDKMPVEQQQELAKAAMENPGLFAALADLTPLKQQLTEKRSENNPAASLWERLRELLALPDIFGTAFAAAMAGVILAVGFGAWLLTRPQRLPDSPVVDLQNGVQTPLVLSDYGRIPFRIVDPQVQGDDMRAADTPSSSECQVFVNGRLERDHVPSVRGILDLSIPVQSLQKGSGMRLTVICGEETKEYNLQPYFK